MLRRIQTEEVWAARFVEAATTTRLLGAVFVHVSIMLGRCAGPID